MPAVFVGSTPQKSVGENDSEWQEYRDSDKKVSVGPEIHLLADFTPIALFRDRIMKVSLNYKHLHLTSEEFAAEGETGGDEGTWLNYAVGSKNLSYGQ